MGRLIASSMRMANASCRPRRTFTARTIYPLIGGWRNGLGRRTRHGGSLNVGIRNANRLIACCARSAAIPLDRRIRDLQLLELFERTRDYKYRRYATE